MKHTRMYKNDGLTRTCNINYYNYYNDDGMIGLMVSEGLKKLYTLKYNLQLIHICAFRRDGSQNKTNMKYKGQWPHTHRFSNVKFNHCILGVPQRGWATPGGGYNTGATVKETKQAFYILQDTKI